LAQVFRYDPLDTYVVCTHWALKIQISLDIVRAREHPFPSP
jgi:hypothetical protein